MKTISKEYKRLCEEHHENTPWGHSDGKWYKTVKNLIKKTNSKTVLDYGAGKGALARMLRSSNFPVTEYDPAVKGKERKPNSKFDFVFSIDVFEHIEPEYIDNVLEEIDKYMKKAGFFVICVKIAEKHWLSDGRNAHILVKPKEWWIKKLSKYWDLQILEGRKHMKHREIVIFVNKEG